MFQTDIYAIFRLFFNANFRVYFLAQLERSIFPISKMFVVLGACLRPLVAAPTFSIELRLRRLRLLL